nr:PREDICTED: fruit bromelain-like [Bemisia tabaci]
MNLREQFEVFKKAYEKKYSSLQEEQKRFEIFKENLTVIENLMAERKGNVVFGVGPYTDFTSDEYLALMGISETEDTSSETSNLERRMLESRGSSNNWNWWRSRSVPPRGPEPSLPPPPPSRTTSVPSFCKYASDFFVGKYPEGGPMLDWRVPVQYYPETEPQNLPGRECKACWAFAAADAIAIELARSRCKIVPLSKQALLDCVPNSGCSGGDLEYALYYIRHHGLPTSEAYPYEATDGECKSHIRAWARIAGYDLVNEESLTTYLKHTPIPTNMHAPKEFQHYVSGVFDVPHCSNEPAKLDHSVVIVGHYKDAWIVRNSSTKKWGIQVCNLLTEMMLKLYIFDHCNSLPEKEPLPTD